MDIKEISCIELEEWREKVNKCKTVGEGFPICREFKDRYNLTDLQATDILLRNKSITKIIK